MLRRASILIFLLRGLAIGQTDGKPFCAIELSVTLADGGNAEGAEAELIDQYGTVRAKRQTVAGRAEICDFGFGPHSLRVKHYSSTTVTLSDLRLIYGMTQQIRVVLNRALPDSHVMVMGTGCSAYLRVTDLDSSAPIEGVRIAEVPSGPTSDRYGRLQFLVPVKRFTIFSLSRTGYGSKSVLLGCAEASDSIEREIGLSKNP
jgi:hypothetical protein